MRTVRLLQRVNLEFTFIHSKNKVFENYSLDDSLDLFRDSFHES